MQFAGHLHRTDDDMPERLLQLLWRAPAWITSIFVHMLILLILFSIPVNWPTQTAAKEFKLGLSNEQDRDRDLFRGDDYLNDPLEVKDPLQATATTWDESQTANDVDMAGIKGIQMDQPKLGTSGMFSLRNEGGRMDAVRRGGGTAGSEAAVERGLEWLYSHQAPNGAWNPAEYHKQCQANAGCGKGSEQASLMEPACTGLGLMCFLGAGYTGEGRQYRSPVNRAINYFLDCQNADGTYKYNHGSFMYNHSIATLAMCEAYAMTRRSDIRRSAEKGIHYLVEHQNVDGGWRYDPARYPSSDSSVTGWVVMALKSARLGGIAVSDETFYKASKWFDQVTDPQTGLVGYTGRNNIASKVPAMTAVGMLCRQFMGAPRSDPNLQKGARILLAFPPRFGDPAEANIYYYYYAMLTLYQYGGKPWETWNPLVRDPLVNTQEKTGCARGSWPPSFYWARQSGAGRVYATAMCILTLEVYYRYLPIYRVNEQLSDIEKALIAYKDALEAYRDFMTAASAQPPDTDAARKAAETAEQKMLNYLTADRDVKDLTDEQEARRQSRLAASTLRLATVYVHTNRFAQAIEVLGDFEKRFPDFGEKATAKKLLQQAYAGEAQTLSGRGQSEEASKYTRAMMESRYEDLIRDPNQSFETYMWVANQFFRLKEYWRAARMYQSIADRFGNDPQHSKDIQQLKPILAKCYMEAPEWNRALALLRELEQGSPQSATIKRDIARCLEELGQHDQALGIYTTLRDGYQVGSEGWWEAKYHIAEVLYLQKKYDQVCEMINRDEKFRPSMGGEKLKLRFLALKRACEQAMGPQKPS